MVIKVMVFGQLVDIISQTELNFNTVKNTEELRKELNNQFPELAHMKFAIAVNKKIVNQNTVLNDKDTVALLPAFSGG